MFFSALCKHYTQSGIRTTLRLVAKFGSAIKSAVNMSAEIQQKKTVASWMQPNFKFASLSEE